MEDTMFLDFNKIPSLSSEFEELYAVRRDLAELLKSICKSCGAMTIYTMLAQYLSQAVARQSQTTDSDELISNYLDMECLLFCVTQLVKCLDSSQIGQIKDVVLLVQNLIDSSVQPSLCEKYVAMRLQCTNFISSISHPLGKFGNDAATEVKIFTQFVLNGFLDAKLTLTPSSSCFVTLCHDCSDVLSPFTE